MFTTLISLIVIGSIFVVITLFALMFRVVVPTNEMHIVQSTKATVSYGKDQAVGNTYYKWPSWVPYYGVKVSVLPMSIFNVKLDGYAAYDTGRVPFVIDIMAFFRITDSNLAAQRVSSTKELTEQLEGILQGACRTILATSEIEQILEGRGTFGAMFTKEVDENLSQWGVQTVKNIELMDIRDAMGSKVIENIMAKKKSLIDMQSRTEVAENNKKAKIAEIEAQQTVDIRAQEAQQQVGQRTAQKEREVGIANENAKQLIKEQEKVTAEKHMEVVKVQTVRESEITREAQLVKADEDRQTVVIKAEGKRQETILHAEALKQQTSLVAEGKLVEAQLNAKGIEAEGIAKGAAEQAILIAPVNTQITLAKEIGENEGYQKYLLGIREIEKTQVVGTAQAEALKVADIKIISNAGDIQKGLDNLNDVFTSKGGTQLGAMLEAFAQTPSGKAVLSKLLNKE